MSLDFIRGAFPRGAAAPPNPPANIPGSHDPPPPLRGGRRRRLRPGGRRDLVSLCIFVAGAFPYYRLLRLLGMISNPRFLLVSPKNPYTIFIHTRYGLDPVPWLGLGPLGPTCVGRLTPSGALPVSPPAGRSSSGTHGRGHPRPAGH